MRILTALLLTSAMFADTPAKSARIMGSPVAGITIEVYSDFQCPHCRDLNVTLKQVIRDYVVTNRVYLVHRDFPLPQHAFAKRAAYYANAAEKIGKYEEICDVLFREQDNWGGTGKVDETVCSVLSAPEAAKVRALAKDPAIAALVQKDVEAGYRARLNQTPTMIITHNGKSYPVAGAVSYPVLKRFLDNLK